MIPPQNIQEEITFFNKCAYTKDYDSLTPYGYQSIIHAFRQYMGGHQNSLQKAVDLGCGTGSFTRRFFANEPHIQVWGVDIALEAIGRADKKNDPFHYIVSDINHLGIKDSSLDLVLFSGVLHHFPQLEPCLKQAWRILKPQGLVLSFDPHAGNPAMWLYRHPHSIFFSKNGITPNEKPLYRQDLEQGLARAGFQSIQIKAISGVTISYLQSPVGRLLLPLYNTAEFLLGLSPWAEHFGSFLIGCAQKI